MTTEPQRMYMQVTSGRGPAACQWVAAQVVPRVVEHARELGLDVGEIQEQPGSKPETLISATLALTGPQATLDQLFAQWCGTIQWIGKSPYRPHHRRTNWFVAVHPCSAQSVVAPELRDSELVVETMRGSGPGGQNINRREMAVRIRHIPTGLCAMARDGRSQKENLGRARERLQQRLAERAREETESRREHRWQQHNEIERGQAIRVYTGKKFRLRKSGPK